MIAYPTNRFKTVWIVAGVNTLSDHLCLIRVCPNRNAAVKALTGYLRDFEDVDIERLSRNKHANGTLSYKLGERIFFIKKDKIK